MDDSVVPFPRPAPDTAQPQVIWVCSCGCSTFLLEQTGQAYCAACSSTAGSGGWTPPPTDRMWDGPEPVYDVQGNGSIDFAKRRMLKHAESPDAAAIIIVREDGTINTWANLDTAEQVAWLGRRLEQVMTLLNSRVGLYDAGTAKDG
jgi:hypothetical protein